MQQAVTTLNPRWPRTNAASAATTTDSDGLLSIVVPTKNDAKYVEVLLQRLERALPIPLEVIVVDDSDDDMPIVVETIREYHRSQVVLIHRSKPQRIDGLGGAVLAGIEVAHSDPVCVINADLRHPAELISRLREEADWTGADVVVARRGRGHSSTYRVPAVRSLVSRVSALLARFLLPARLANEPVTDFFLLRKDSLPASTLRAHGGFKMLLTFLTRYPGMRVTEVAIGSGGSLARE